MKKILMLLTTLFMIGLSSCAKNVECKKDKDCGIGTCDWQRGVCRCPIGYYGDKCEKYDACRGVDCYNDGVCEDGTCKCVNGFYGDECQLRKDPNQIKMNQIAISFSYYNSNGAEWDYNTVSPDIYVVIKKGSEIVFSSSVSENANFLNTHYFLIGKVFDDAEATYTIELWDEDTGVDGDTQDDFMGSKNAVFFPVNGEINELQEYPWNSSGSSSPTFQILFNYKWDY